MTTVLDSTILTLQNNIAFNASDLTGTTVNFRNYNAALVWFVPASSYDGTANFEISPDAGATWFGTTAYYTADASRTLVASIATPVSTRLYVCAGSENSVLRVRMSGGSQGSLTVKAKLIRYIPI